MFQSSIESNGCISAILNMASINERADGTGQAPDVMSAMAAECF